MHSCACARYRSELRTAEEVRLRYQVAPTIAASLDELAAMDDRRRVLMRCRACGQHWQESADLHGRRAHYAIPPVRAERWRTNPEPDQASIASWRSLLGPETGPEACRTANCPRLRARLSVFCAKHHYVLNLGGTLPPNGELPAEFRD